MIAVIDLIELMPKSLSSSIFSRQLLRCASSVGANYRAACRAKSDADFINKLKIVEEEADECMYFLELLDHVDGGKNKVKIQQLINEADELVAIYVSSIKTVRNRKQYFKS